MFNQVPAGRAWVDASDNLRIASVDTEFVYTTVAVRKSELYPVATPEVWDAYREAAHWVDLRRSALTGLGGPLHPVHANPETSGIDIRVRWTGREKLALRSITLRDTLGQLLQGPDPIFRQMLGRARH